MAVRLPVRRLLQHGVVPELLGKSLEAQGLEKRLSNLIKLCDGVPLREDTRKQNMSSVLS